MNNLNKVCLIELRFYLIKCANYLVMYMCFFWIYWKLTKTNLINEAKYYTVYVSGVLIVVLYKIVPVSTMSRCIDFVERIN